MTTLSPQDLELEFNIEAFEAELKERLAWVANMNEKLRDAMRLDAKQMNTPFYIEPQAELANRKGE